MQIVKTICQMCYFYCGLDVAVEDGRILRVEGMPEHPTNRGRLCAKGLASGQLVTDPHRLKTPLLIVVDPRFTPTAAKADLFLQPRPGTTGALVLSMVQVIVEEGLFDADFVEEWTTGFDRLRQFVQDYRPEKVAAITRVGADRIRQAARLMATAQHFERDRASRGARPVFHRHSADRRHCPARSELSRARPGPLLSLSSLRRLQPDRHAGPARATRRRQKVGPGPDLFPGAARGPGSRPRCSRAWS